MTYSLTHSLSDNLKARDASASKKSASPDIHGRYRYMVGNWIQLQVFPSSVLLAMKLITF